MGLASPSVISVFMYDQTLLLQYCPYLFLSTQCELYIHVFNLTSWKPGTGVLLEFLPKLLSHYRKWIHSQERSLSKLYYLSSEKMSTLKTVIFFFLPALPESHTTHISESQDSQNHSGKFCKRCNNFIVRLTLYSPSKSWDS